MPRTALTTFSKGEISPSAEARFELPLYGAGVRRALNVKVQRTGGLKKRMGTRFVAEALSSSSHLIAFQFSDEQAYALEFAQALMRPFALGGAILETGLKITAITKAANAKLTVAYHGYKVGDQLYVSGVKGMIEINDRFLTVVSVVDANNFTVNFNSTNASTFTSDTGQVNTKAPDPPPVPPPVPTPTPVPTPPPTGGGGGGGYDGGDSTPTYGYPGTPDPVPPAPWKDTGLPPQYP